MASAASTAQVIERRRAILRFIKAYKKNHESSPTIEEIRVAVGLASKNSVQHH